MALPLLWRYQRATRNSSCVSVQAWVPRTGSDLKKDVAVLPGVVFQTGCFQKVRVRFVEFWVYKKEDRKYELFIAEPLRRENDKGSSCISLC